jgi:hypothetical protein
MKKKIEKCQINKKSISVIQTRLVGSEESLRSIWLLMKDYYSEFVKTLLEYLSSHPDFNIWLDQCSFPDAILKDYAKTCQTISPYQSLPGRFRTSAVTLVKNTYLSWFAVKKRQLNSLKGKKRFFALFKSDEELQKDSGLDFYTITTKAEKLLLEVRQKLEKEWKKNKTIPLDDESMFWEITNNLYDLYERTKSNEIRCLIAYLIKNSNKIPDQPENFKDYQLRRKSKEIEIQRLEKQLQCSAPKARLLDDSQWFKALEEALQPITEVEQLEKLQIKLLRESHRLPYPVFYGSNIDIDWWINDNNRICVTFNGLKTKNIIFEIACNQRQLHYFQRFVVDFQRLNESDETLLPGLMLLRSAHIVWKPGTGQGEPWLDNHLHLHCAIDNRLRSLSKTETAGVISEKIAGTQKQIENFTAKAHESSLTNEQKQKLKALETSLKRLQSFDIERLASSENENERGDPSIVLGVAIGIKKPITIAIVNLETQQVITYRSTKQLLSRIHKVPDKKNHQNTGFTHRTFKEITNYELFQRHQALKHHNKHERHKAQIEFAKSSKFKENNLGLYIARLLAEAVSTVAREYRVGTIVLPDMTNIREIIETNIRARAEIKYPGNKTAQKRYALDFRTGVNQWNYRQLAECIRNTASGIGIEVVTLKQLTAGTGTKQAEQLAFALGRKRHGLQQARDFNRATSSTDGKS